jgi:hypothetical protein
MKLFSKTKKVRYEVNGVGVKTLQDVVDLLKAFRFGVTVYGPNPEMEELCQRNLVTKTEG